MAKSISVFHLSQSGNPAPKLVARQTIKYSDCTACVAWQKCLKVFFCSQNFPQYDEKVPSCTENKVENPHNGPSAFLVIQLCGSREIEYVVNWKWNYTKLKVE